MPHFGVTHLSVKDKFPRPPVYISNSLTGLVFVGRKCANRPRNQDHLTWPISNLWKITFKKHSWTPLLNRAHETNISAAFNCSGCLALLDASDGRLRNLYFGSSYPIPSIC